MRTHATAVQRTFRRPAGPTGKPVAPAGGRRARWWRDDRGANPIEFAILFPVIVVLLFAGVQISLYFLAQSEAQGAAQAGVDAQRGYLGSPSAAKAAVQVYLADGHGWFIPNPPPGSPPPPPPPPPPGPATISFTVHGTAMSLIPGWSWSVSATASGPLERLTQPGGP